MVEPSQSLGLGLSSVLPLTGELLEDEEFAPGLAPGMGSSLTLSPWGITVPARQYAVLPMPYYIHEEFQQ